MRAGLFRIQDPSGTVLIGSSSIMRKRPPNDIPVDSDPLFNQKNRCDKDITPMKMSLRTVPDDSYLLSACCTATATATVMPTMGLLPAPRKPIISTCAGTDEEPANCASECIRPMVSVMP